MESDAGSGIDCFACNQENVPVFHSTTYDGDHRPQWEALAGSSLVPIHTRSHPNAHAPSTSPGGMFGHILDPRSLLVQRWNRLLLLARGVSLAVDPLFLYTLTLMVSDTGAPCVYLDWGLATIVTAVRTCADAVQLCHLWLQLRLAYVSKESLVVGCGRLVWDARAIAARYMGSMRGFWFDAVVILPVPQAVLWLVVPRLLKEEKIKLIITTLLINFLLQFLPKVYHSVCLMARMRQATGYIFGSIWWGFGLNLIAYLIASHVTGGCWYVLATQRVVTCLRQQCERSENCDLSFSCPNRVCSRFLLAGKAWKRPCGGNSSVTRESLCLEVNGPFRYGIYEPALPVISSNSLAVKILYPIFWGLLNLSSFGNELNPTSKLLEVSFSICIVLCGLTLFTLLIGNIQVFLHVLMANKKKMQLRRRDIEWWMRRRQLPSGLKRRVRNFEHKKWETMGGEDEVMKWIQQLPQGLRRDIQRFLCLDLIKRVPLFHCLDDLILDNICDRVKPLVYSKREKIIREGDPVQRMVFIVRGRVKRSQGLSKGVVATSMLEAGCFLGDELLSWCLSRPFMERLPASSATFTCVESAEAYGLEAGHLRYISDHFRYKFASERLKRTARYHSSNWRTWAAVNIQFAWRRYRTKIKGHDREVVHVTLEDRLRKCAAMFLSIRPHDHLE